MATGPRTRVHKLARRVKVAVDYERMAYGRRAPVEGPGLPVDLAVSFDDDLGVIPRHPVLPRALDDGPHRAPRGGTARYRAGTAKLYNEQSKAR